MKMENKLLSLDTPLFEGIAQQDRRPMLDCITYHTATFSKGEIIAFEQENMKHIGIVLSGAVDMIKEDLWGNKTLLVRMRKNELFGGDLRLRERQPFHGDISGFGGRRDSLPSL